MSIHFTSRDDAIIGFFALTTGMPACPLGRQLYAVEHDLGLAKSGHNTAENRFALIADLYKLTKGLSQDEITALWLSHVANTGQVTCEVIEDGVKLDKEFPKGLTIGQCAEVLGTSIPEYKQIIRQARNRFGNNLSEYSARISQASRSTVPCLL